MSDETYEDGVFQVDLWRPDPPLYLVTDLDEMERALSGSMYTLDRAATIANDNVARITVPTEDETERLMNLEDPYVVLPSRYVMEVPMPW